MQLGPLGLVCISSLVPIEKRLHLDLLLEVSLTLFINSTCLRIQLIFIPKKLEEHLGTGILWALNENETLEVNQKLRLASLISVSHIGSILFDGFFLINKKSELY